MSKVYPLPPKKNNVPDGRRRQLCRPPLRRRSPPSLRTRRFGCTAGTPEQWWSEKALEGKCANVAEQGSFKLMPCPLISSGSRYVYYRPLRKATNNKRMKKQNKAQQSIPSRGLTSIASRLSCTATSSCAAASTSSCPRRPRLLCCCFRLDPNRWRRQLSAC
jgi:hypothetical protein